MNNLLEMLINNGPAVGQIAKQFNLSSGQTQSVIGQLVPVLARAMQKNTTQKSGLDSLVSALQKGNHQRYFDQPEVALQDNVRDDGNGILGHLLGGKDVSRGLANHAAEKTGISSTLIKQMLPVVAALAMGALRKQSSTASTESMLSPANGGSLLNSFLDADKDGSIADDLLGLASRILTN